MYVYLEKDVLKRSDKTELDDVNTRVSRIMSRSWYELGRYNDVN